MYADVAVVSMWMNGDIQWAIKRLTRNKPWIGWAKNDGTFTAGVNPDTEYSQAVVFHYSRDAIRFAQQHGWNMLGVIEEKGDDNTEVVVLPPYPPVQQGYAIGIGPPMRFATEDGSFNGSFWGGRHEPIQFPTAEDAIAFAEWHGWTVINKVNSSTIWNPPTSSR